MVTERYCYILLLYDRLTFTKKKISITNLIYAVILAESLRIHLSS